MEVLCKLLDHQKFNVNASDINGYISMYLASGKNHVRMLVKLLDQENFNVNIANVNVLTPLHMASWCNHSGVLRKLLNHPNIQMDVIDNSDLTALHIPPQGISHYQISIGTTPIRESIRDPGTVEYQVRRIGISPLAVLCGSKKCSSVS